MQNSAIHIHLYLTDDQNELTAYENIKQLKSFGFKIIVTSPLPLPNKFYDYIDIYYHDKENLLLQKEYEDVEPIIYWFSIDNVKLNFVVREVQKHSLAVLRSMIKGCDVALMNDIKYIIRFEYDDIFGPISISEINKILNEIEENNLDFYLFKNDYEGRRSDVSAHLLFYNCQKFLNVFGNIKNEDDYNLYLDQLGVSKKSLILEQFLLLLIKENIKNLKVKFNDSDFLLNKFSDTTFNKYHIPYGSPYGVLSDVMKIRVKDEILQSRICLAAQNIGPENKIKIYFDLFDDSDKKINTISQEINKNHWYYNVISINTIKKVKIRHQNLNYHKEVEINLDNIGPEIVMS